MTEKRPPEGGLKLTFLGLFYQDEPGDPKMPNGSDTPKL
jgi:hypothetical protein